MQIEQNRRNSGIRSRVNENGLKPRYRGGVGEEAESRGTDNSLYQEIVAANWAVAPIPSTVSLPSPFLFLVFPTRPALPSVSSFFLSPSFGLNNCDGPRVDINLRAIICLFSSSHSFISARAFSRVSFSSVKRKKIYIKSFRSSLPASCAYTAIKLLEFAIVFWIVNWFWIIRSIIYSTVIILG